MLLVIAVLAGLMLSELKKLNHPKRVQRVLIVPLEFNYISGLSKSHSSSMRFLKE